MGSKQAFNPQFEQIHTINGKDGADGKSAYQIAVDNGFDGTEVEWLESLKGKDGQDGVSCTHEWNGTTLTVTSASGTTSSDLKGEKGDKGDTGDAGKDAFPITDSKSGMTVTTEDAANTNILNFTVNDEVDVEQVKVIGRNFFHRDYGSSVSHASVTVEWDAENQEFIFNGTTNAVGDFCLVSPLKLDWEIGENYTVSVRRVSGTAKLPEGATGTTYSWSIFSNDAKKYIRSGNLAQDFVDLFSFTGKAFEAAGYVFYLQSWKPGTVFDNYRVKVQIEKGSAVSDWEAYREETVSVADAHAIVLQKGYNNVMTVPLANITVDYVVDTKMYIDNKFEALQKAIGS